MYDTIDFILKSEQAPDIDFLSEIPCNLSNISEHKFNDNQKVIVIGYLDNLKVVISENSISIKGQSLSKWYFNGDAFKTLQRSDVQKAIEKISDKLHVPFNNAKVTRIDIAMNLIMKYPESVYYDCLGNLNKFNRLVQSDSLYYNQTNKQLVFYSKIKEQKVKKQPIPDIYQNRNVLRYELRFKKRICKLLNKPEIKASDLFDETFYMQVIDIYKRSYDKIQKIKQLNLNYDNMKNTKTFRDYFYLAGLKYIFGNEIEAAKIIETLSKKGVFENRVQKSRIKSEIQKAFKLPEITTDNECILELTKKIKDATRLYR